MSLPGLGLPGGPNVYDNRPPLRPGPGDISPPAYGRDTRFDVHGGEFFVGLPSGCTLHVHTDKDGNVIGGATIQNRSDESFGQLNGHEASMALHYAEQTGFPVKFVRK